MERYPEIPDLNESGFSLIELIIYMGLLGILMAAVFSSFIPVMQKGSRQWRIAETKVETGNGLDLLRADLEHAGFGLPWEFPAGAVINPYSEPAVPATMNDAPNVPRAILSEDLSISSMNTSDYLSIKALNVVLGDTSQKWGWLGRDAAHATAVQSLSDNALVVADRVIVINPKVSLGQYRQLVIDQATGDYFARGNAANLDPFSPPATPNDPDGVKYLVYGIDNIDPRRPYNRSDYFLLNANVPRQCAPGTGVLHKATLNQANDNFSLLPIVDCVADFQVVYYLDTNGDGGWDTRANASGLAGLTAQQIRERVKSVRCYILTHEGGIDREYTHPNVNKNVGETDPVAVNALPVPDPDSTAAGILLAGRAFDLSTLAGIGATWRNYRWKVYSIAVTPKNLQ